MAFSYVLYTGNGTLRDYAFSFPYLDPLHIQVNVNGVAAPYTFLSANTVRITTAPPVGQIIEIKRVTVQATAPVDFVDGSVLKEADLDRLVLYSTYAAQESLDAQQRTIFQKANGDFTASSRHVSDVADPVLAQDAVTLNYVQTTFSPAMDAKVAAAAASASAASTSAGQASTSATNASVSQGAASASATAASGSAGAASTSASAAAASASAASTSASNALASKNAAATSESNAATSASTATTQASSAAGSASSASASSGTAGTQATNAANSASAAASSATAANTSKVNAANSETNAATSASNAAASAASVVQSNLVHIAGTETITGAKTFSNLTSVNGGPLSGFRNKLTNGSFSINQRGSATVSSNALFPCDRWGIRSSAAFAGIGASLTVSSAGITVGSQRMLQVYAGTIVVPAAAEYCMISQIIEGINTADLQWGTNNAKPVTLSFIAYGSIGGVMSVSLRSGLGQSIVVPVTIPAGSAPRVSVTFPGPTSGSWAIGNGEGMEVAFCFSAGTNYQTASNNVWVAGNIFAHTTQSNFADTAGRYFLLGDVQLEPGSVGTPFEIRDQGVELLMCMRYFQSVNGYSAGYTGAGTGNTAQSQLPVPMRATPTVTPVGTATNVNVTGSAVNAVGNAAFAINSIGAGTGGYISVANASLSAEL